MLNKVSTHLLKAGSLFALTLVIIPGCNFFQNKESKLATSTPVRSADGGPVLCKLNGKAVINEADFNSNISQMLQANPYFRGAGAQSLPSSIKRKFFDELIKQELIIVDAENQNLERDSEFKKALEEMEKLVKRSLTVQFFEKKIYDGIVVDDTEIAKHFEENKDRFIKNAGGVLVGGVRFDSESEAKEFQAKAATLSTYTDFEKLAKEKSGQFRSFGRVSKQEASRGYQAESTPEQIKDAALNAKSLPHVVIVKAGKDIWVVHASDKQEVEVFELNEIKPQIVNMIKNNKFREKLDKSIADLKKNITIEVNEDFFKDKGHDVEGSQDEHLSSHAIGA